VKLAIGIPAYGGKVSMGHVFQGCQLAWAFSKNMLASPLVLSVDTASVDKARNILVARTRDAGADWLLMCDADTYCPKPPAIFEMLKTGINRGAAVIGAPVKMRKRPGYNVSAGEGFEPLAEDTWRGRVVEVERIGTAFTAVNLQWLVANWPDSPWFMFEHLPGPQPDTVGEDFWFCRGVRRRGGLILADGRYEPYHERATEDSGMLLDLGLFDAANVEEQAPCDLRLAASGI